MPKGKLKIAIITNIISTYRQGFYDRLFARDDIQVTVYCQDKMPGMNIISIHEKYPDNIQIIKFLSAKKEKIVWQFLPWRHIAKHYDVIFVQGNPRVLSDAFFASYLKLANKNIVLWTMAHSYRNNKFTEKVRLSWTRIFTHLFVYTDREVEFLKRSGFTNKCIIGMNNGLDQKYIDHICELWPRDKLNLWQTEKGLDNKIIILSVGRLEHKNKFEQVLQALPLIIKQIPNILWCLIGDGDEREKLEMLTKKYKVSDHVTFIGLLYNEFELAPYFLSSKLFVYPGSIGLALLHAYGYGLPVVTHGTEALHGPEYAAFTHNVSGRNFIIDDINNLAKIVIRLLNDHEARNIMKGYILKVVHDSYNVDIMVDRFIAIAKRATVRS